MPTACPSCGASVNVGAHFCPSCGAALPARSDDLCPSCGAERRAGRRFCPHCGSEYAATAPAGATAPGGARQVARPSRPKAAGGRRRGPLFVAGAGILIVGVVAAASFWLLGRGGDDGVPTNGEPGTQESAVTVLGEEGMVDASGLAVRPPVRLEHPAGAVAEVPGASVLFGETVDLRRVTFADDSPAWDWDGHAWQFVSNSGLVLREDVTFTLPATGAGDEQVIALSHTGDWITIPSTATSLAAGVAAREVRVGDVPVPWILVVARPVPGAPTPEQQLAAPQLEQLYWTDRDQWNEQIVAAAKEALESPINEEFVSARPATVALPRLPSDVIKDLDRAFVILGSSRLSSAFQQTAATLPVGAMNTPMVGLALSPMQAYLEGLDRLDALRKEWVQNRDAWTSEYPDALQYSDNQTIEQALESALAYYAPWGISVMRYLLHTGTISEFDLRIVSPYGELPFADAPLANCLENPDLSRIIKRDVDKGASLSCFLRLYSRAAMQDTWVDWLKDWKLQTVMRWAPALLVTAGIVSGAATPALLFAAADEVINQVQSYYSSNAPAAYLNAEVASSSGSVGAFVTDAGATLIGVEGATMSVGAARLGVAQTLYSLALLYGVSQTDWYMLQDIKPLTSGTRSYCPRSKCVSSWWTGDYSPIAGYDQIPPIQVMAVLQDKPEGHPAAGYPAQRIRLRAWTLPLQKYGADLHRMLVNGVRCEDGTIGIGSDVLCPARNNWRGGLPNLPFDPYQQDAWPEVSGFSAPAGQALRLSLPKTVLATIASEYNLGSNPTPADYGLVLRAEAPDGSRAVFAIEEFLEPGPGEETNRVYFQVVIDGRWKGEPAFLSDLPSQYEGVHTTMSGETLQTKLFLRIQAQADEDPRATANVDFRAPGVENIQIYPDTPGEEHVHFLKAGLVPEAGIWGNYDVTRWELVTGHPDLIPMYEEGVFEYSPECALPGKCRFRVLDTGGNTPYQIAEVWRGEVFARVADSRPYLVQDPESKLLAPLANDDFFRIEGNILTGSSAWNVYGNPGSAAIVGAWETVRAEFAPDGTVSGTITGHQLVNGVEWSIEFRFEAARSQ